MLDLLFLILPFLMFTGALIKSNSQSTISGSINGTTYSRNRSGAYIRNRTVPVNTITTRRTIVRSLLASIASAWKNLTQPERDAWNDAAASGQYPRYNAVGDLISRTGFNLYMDVNGVLQNNTGGLDFTSSPPPPVVFPILTAIDNMTLTAIQTGANEALVIDASWLPPAIFDGSMLIYATSPISAGRSNGSGAFKLLSALENPDSSDSIDIQALYEAVFGTGWKDAENTGNRIIIKFRFMKDGLVSPYVQLTTLIALA